MAKPYFQAMDDLTSTTETDPLDVGHLENVSVVVGGTFAGTWELQVSPDGILWVPHATITGKTAPFADAIGYRVKQVRLSCSVYSSGTIESFITGDDEDLRG